MLAMGLLSGLVMYLTAGATVGFMLGAYSGPAFESGREYMQLISLFYIFCFTGNTFAGYFDGLGRVTIPFIGAASHIALRVVLSWLWIDSMGMRAVALATGIGWVMVNLLWEIIRRRSARKAPAGAGTQG